MEDQPSIRAIPRPADAVFPEALARRLGLVLLDTRFPRPLGDAGNPASWRRPVLTRVVARAWPDRVVATAGELQRSPLVPLFVEAVQALEREGACAVTTSCGFLVLLQDLLQAAVKVPVITSSLLQLPALLAREQQVGVLTISAQHLGAGHLGAAGVPPARLADVVVQGVDPAGEFASVLLGNREQMDVEAARKDVVAAALALKERAPHLATVVLECTNMPPHAHAVRAATGWRVLSLFDDPALA